MTVKFEWRHLWWVMVAWALFTSGPDVVRGEWHLVHSQQVAVFTIVVWAMAERAVRP